MMVVSPEVSSFSKLPPLVPVMLLVRSRLLVCTLSGAVYCTVPEVALTGMVMLWPLARVITSGVPVTGELTVAV
ncbi:hypothetical protein D3C78_1653020 [compost metagenome]